MAATATSSRHAAGNWLIDSPKFVTPLVRQLEALGGIAHIFLTHRDDVADAERYAEHFRSRRIIHRDELSSQPGAEVVLDGEGPWELAPGFLAIPTPGHTKGHCVLLFQDRFLFTGDHLDWDRDGRRLSASEDYCWYSWPQQAESMGRLADYRFEWVLPGHGQRVHLPAARDARANPALGRGDEGEIMARNILRTGKKTRPKTAEKGKRYRCAQCRKRSPKPVKTPAPWYCPHCSNQDAAQASGVGQLRQAVEGAGVLDRARLEAVVAERRGEGT